MKILATRRLDIETNARIRASAVTRSLSLSLSATFSLAMISTLVEPSCTLAAFRTEGDGKWARGDETAAR